MAKFKNSTERRKARVRRAVKAGANGRPRLSVFRSSKHIYAQIIDDLKGGTVVAASSMEKTLRDGGKTGADIDAAKEAGGRTGEREGRHRRGVRSRPLPLSRTRQGAC
jgi:large subunit ribosomal protein L18